MPFDRAATLRQAEKFLRQGRLESAIAEYARALEEEPQDWKTADVLGDLYARVGRVDDAVARFIRVADHLYTEGFVQRAAAHYKKALKLRPDQDHALWRCVDIAASQRLFADARTHLRAVIDLRRGRGDEAGASAAEARIGSLESEGPARGLGPMAADPQPQPDGEGGDRARVDGEWARDPRSTASIEALRAAVAADPGDAALSADLYRRLIARGDPAGAFALVEALIDAAIIGRDFVSAAAEAQRFLTHVPGYVPALMRLVEVAVNGPLDAATLSHAQAHLIDAHLTRGAALDALRVAQDLVARDPSVANIERLQRALVLADRPDAESSRRPPHAAPDPTGQDLVARVEPGGTEEPRSPSDPGGAESPPGDLDAVFVGLRAEAARQGDAGDVHEQIRRALELHAAGDVDGCVAALRAASRSPALRFAAASLAGRVLHEHRRLPEAIEWLERAAEASAPTPEDMHRLLYDLAVCLEVAGEGARALAVWIEIQADAGPFRDVESRIARLNTVQVQG